MMEAYLKTRGFRLGMALAVVVTAATFASEASASPQWKFDGEALGGVETILGGSQGTILTIPGMTTKCKNFLHMMKIQNSAGTGVGELTYAPIFDCSASEACEVKTFEARQLPWPVELTTVSSKHYVVIEEIEIAVEYAGEECVLSETEIPVTGSAGGYFDNGSEAIAFSAASFSATETQLKAFGTPVELNAILSAEAFGPHLGEALSVG